MPAPQSEALATSAKQYFSNQGVQLPMNWKSMGEIFPQAFTIPERTTPANAPTTLYHEPTLNKYHTQSARTLSREYERYIEGICKSISKAIGQWMKAAAIVSVNVAGPVGTMLPGGVNAPQLYPMIIADAPKKNRSELKYSKAIASAVSEAWDGWHQGLSGILSYPGFNGMPMVNVPAPLISFVSTGEIGLAPANLAPAMQHKLNDPGALHAKTLFESVANAFFIQFQAFKAATLIMGVTVTAAPAPPVPPAGMAVGAAQTAAEAPEEADDDNTDTPEVTEVTTPPPPCPIGMVIPIPGNFI